MTDLVDRLRSALPTHREDWDGFDPIMAEAAAEIERQQQVIANMMIDAHVRADEIERLSRLVAELQNAQRRQELTAREET